MVQTIPDADHSHDPIAWQHAADALRSLGMDDVADVCHEVAGEMMRDANAAEDAAGLVISIIKGG